MKHNLKIALRIKLIGKTSIKIEFIRVHPKIKDFSLPIFHIDDDNKFRLQKSDNITMFNKNVFIMPSEVTKKNDGVCKYIFISEKERYNTLKRFSKTLLNFSKSSLFKDCDEVNRILFFRNNWFVY